MKKYILLLLLVLIVFTKPLRAQTQVGLQLYSLRNEFKTDVPGTLAKIKSWGIKEVEGGGTYGLPMEEFQKLLKENGISVVSVGADFKQLKEKSSSSS